MINIKVTSGKQLQENNDLINYGNIALMATMNLYCVRSQNEQACAPSMSI